jgi:hypothetical protein
MTKLPAKLFADFSPSGGLSRILCCALRYKKEKVVHANAGAWRKHAC